MQGTNKHNQGAPEPASCPPAERCGRPVRVAQARTRSARIGTCMVGGCMIIDNMHVFESCCLHRRDTALAAREKGLQCNGATFSLQFSEQSSSMQRSHPKRMRSR